MVINREYALRTVYEFWDDDLCFCLCGAPGETLKIFKELLNLIFRRYDHDDEFNYDDFKAGICNLFQCKTNEMSMEIYYMMAYLLNTIDVLEHGSSIGGSWLTSNGKILRACLNLLNDDDLDNFDLYYEESKQN